MTLHVHVGGRKRGMRRGVPDALMRRDNRARPIDIQLLPSTSEAVHQYRINGGTISGPCSFGTDPLENNAWKKDVRFQSFCSKYSFKSLFCDVSNGCGSSFSEALTFLIDVTYRLAHS